MNSPSRLMIIILLNLINTSIHFTKILSGKSHTYLLERREDSCSFLAT